jgi:hypothetical protein
LGEILAGSLYQDAPSFAPDKLADFSRQEQRTFFGFLQDKSDALH